MPIHIRVTQKKRGSSIYNVIKSVENVFDDRKIQRELGKIRTKVLNDLDRFIAAHRRRQRMRHGENWRVAVTSNLLTAMRQCSRIVPYKNRLALEIGNKGYLKKHAPYWYVLNYGKLFRTSRRYVPFYGKGKLGYFGANSAPSTSLRNQAFHFSRRGQKNSFLMIPQNPVTPMYYLNYMAKRFAQEVEALRLQWGREEREAIRSAKKSDFLQTFDYATLNTLDIIAREKYNMTLKQMSLDIIKRELKKFSR